MSPREVPVVIKDSNEEKSLRQEQKSQEVCHLEMENGVSFLDRVEGPQSD